VPTPARTSLDEIIAAAWTILEMDGLEGLTMQRVAVAVGVRPPSLYKRVRSRGDLVRLLVEDAHRRLAAAIDAAAGSGDPWRDLAAVAHAFRAFAHAHPRAYEIVFGSIREDWRPDLATLAPANDAVLSIAASLAGPDQALNGARMLVAWAHGFVSMELAGAFRLGGDIDDAFTFGIERLAVALAAPAR
jgi:AcrR family transcriptional regulator